MFGPCGRKERETLTCPGRDPVSTIQYRSGEASVQVETNGSDRSDLLGYGIGMFEMDTPGW